MTKQENDKKPQGEKNLIEILEKKRYAYLLNKAQKGSLSASELKEVKQLEGGTLPPGTVRTQAEVAKALRVATRTVEYWVRDGMPQTPEGNYDLIEIQAWRAIKNQKKTDKGESKEHWDKKLKEYKAKFAKLEYQKACGEVIIRDEVEKGQVARILAIKRALLALPKVVAPVVGGMEPREIQVYMTERIKELIKQFAGQ